MKKCMVLLCLIVGSYRANAQAEELAQLALNIEKLAQFKQMLSDLKKAYDILFNGYTTIKNISEGNFRLHDAFLDGLLQVSPAVKKYQRIADIIQLQRVLVKEYPSAYHRFRTQGHFTIQELDHMGKLYGKLVTQSAGQLAALVDILTANQLRMSDDERLSAIDQIYDRMRSLVHVLRQFNHSTTVLDIQRSHAQTDVNVMRQLHGLNK